MVELGSNAARRWGCEIGVGRWIVNVGGLYTEHLGYVYVTPCPSDSAWKGLQGGSERRQEV